MNKKTRGSNGYFILILLLMALLIIPSFMDSNRVEYTRGEMMEDLEAGNIVYASISPGRETPTGEVDFVFSDGPSKTLYVTDVTEIEELLISHGIDPQVRKVEEESWFLTSILPVLLIVVGMAFFFMMMQGQNAGGSSKMMNFGKSRAKLSLGDGKITLKDVAGLKEEKEDLEEIVEFLKEPAKFTKVGARIPKGVLLEGAPGTGKTLLAKAIAGEAGVPFFSISGSDFVEMFVGVGASRVRDLFEEAKKNGYVKTIMNRKRVISELSSSNFNVKAMGERMALNTPIQGTSADIIKKAMVEVDKRLKENGTIRVCAFSTGGSTKRTNEKGEDEYTTTVILWDWEKYNAALDGELDEDDDYALIARVTFKINEKNEKRRNFYKNIYYAQVVIFTMLGSFITMLGSFITMLGSFIKK